MSSRITDKDHVSVPIVIKSEFPVARTGHCSKCVQILICAPAHVEARERDRERERERQTERDTQRDRIYPPNSCDSEISLL